MCFSIRRTVLDKFHITADNKEIEVVNEFKYLGITLDPQLKFDTHLKKLSKTVKTVQTTLDLSGHVSLLRQLICVSMPWFCHICPTALLHGAKPMT